MQVEPLRSTESSSTEPTERAHPAAPRGWPPRKMVWAGPIPGASDEEAKVEYRRSRGTLLLAATGSALCLALVVLDGRAPASNEPIRLAVAALIGLLVTAVHRRSAREPQGQAMQHAQVLLCVSGAMMMVLIHDSLARAFGIAGAASIIRFRTPVEDPRDAAVLFLLMALGMASGLGAFALAGSGTAMLCLFLLLLDRFAAPQTRSFSVELISTGSAFPSDHVRRMFAHHGVAAELREMSHGEAATVTYLATCAAGTSLEALNADLMAGETKSLRAIAWEPARKKQL